MKKILTLVFIIVVQVSFGQAKWNSTMKFYKQMSYIQATNEYESKIKDNEQPPAEVLSAVGDAYYQLGNFKKASQIYGNLHQLQSQTMADADFRRYDMSLRSAGRLEDANRLVKSRIEINGDDKEKKRFIAQLKQLDSLAKKQPLHQVKTISNNTRNSDFGVAFYGNNVVYASSKDTVNLKSLYKLNNQPYLAMYEAEMSHSTGSFSNEKKFLPEIQNKYHNATVAFSPDLKTAYYTTNSLHKKKLILDDKRINNVQIVKVDIKNGKGENPTTLFFDNKEYSFGHPFVCKEGKWLYFVSDMPGGYGETDIYRVEIFGDASYGKVENLGPEINTPGREMFPTCVGDRLYFASDGYYGYGGLDIYQSKIVNNKFSTPVNLGKPVNSTGDDFGYIIDEKGTYGYLSSNREGGKGDDDIYFFTKEKEACDQIVQGYVTDRKTGFPLEGATVMIFDEFGSKISETLTDVNGTYKIAVPCGKVYVFKATYPEYSQEEQEVKALNGEKPMEHIDFKLDKLDNYLVDDGDFKKININPIYFDYDKWDILPQAEVELNKVVDVMKRFPKVTIRIESHTDSRGKDAYNMVLSDNRAKATQAYILRNGISSTRISSATGYGESRLKNKCSNNVKCSEAEHSINRRSDFIIEEM